MSNYNMFPEEPTFEGKVKTTMLKIITVILLISLGFTTYRVDKLEAENSKLQKKITVAEKALEICSAVNLQLDEEVHSAKGCE